MRMLERSCQPIAVQKTSLVISGSSSGLRLGQHRPWGVDLCTFSRILRCLDYGYSKMQGPKKDCLSVSSSQLWGWPTLMPWIKCADFCCAWAQCLKPLLHCRGISERLRLGLEKFWGIVFAKCNKVNMTRTLFVYPVGQSKRRLMVLKLLRASDASVFWAIT